MSAVQGTRPILPGHLGKSAWWNEPVSATRLAAMRIATGIVLLVDVLFLFWPYRNALLGPESMGAPHVFAERFAHPSWSWSVLRVAPISPSVLLATWALAAVMLILGVYPRVAAFVAWVIAMSVRNANPYVSNSGDLVRQFLLFLLMIAPCGATWTFIPWKKREPRAEEPPRLYPWPLRLVAIQLCFMYCVNGIYKLPGAEWRDGSVLYWVMSSASWARYPNVMPLAITTLFSWLTLVWEVGFPILFAWRKTRVVALVIGAGFHVGSGLNLELALFPAYALCAYAVFVPWETLRQDITKLRARMRHHAASGT